MAAEPSASPTVVSINVGLPREVPWRGQSVRTSIFKSPITGAVVVKSLNVAGDAQSDLTVHGGADKAVYVYPSEHYRYWAEQLPGVPLPWGAFGENFTTAGLLEDSVRIGDRLQVGTAELLVTQPRMPCFKLSIRFDRADMVKRFFTSGRSGFYLRVLMEGEATAGDAVTVLSREEDGITVADIVALYSADQPSAELLRRAVASPALPQEWREYFRERATSSRASAGTAPE